MSDSYPKVKFAVEATDCEKVYLWEKHSSKMKSWVSCESKLVTIGRFHDEPICVSLIYDMINGQKVLFYNPTSNTVKWDMVEKWLKENVFEKSYSKTNATNVHIVFNELT